MCLMDAPPLPEILSLKGFGDEEITALSMNNYFSIKISNTSFRNLTKFCKGLA